MSDIPAGQRLPDGNDLFLRGGPGAPTLRISDHYGDRELRYREQLRVIQDQEIKDLLAKVEQREIELQRATPIPLEELRTGTLANMALAQHEREEKARPFAELAELEAEIPRLLAEAKAADPPSPTRYGQALSQAEQAHERALGAAFSARNRRAAKALCGLCRVVGGDCGGHGSLP